MELASRAERALLERQRLPATFGVDAVRPSYDGLGLVNAAVTPLRWLAPGSEMRDGPPTAPPFDAALYGDGEVAAAWRAWQDAGPVRHAIVLLVDGLGYDQLRTLINEGVTLNLRREAARGFLAPITSVYPSTTTAALTSLATGYPPAAHGIIGTTMYLRGLGSSVNFIGHRPLVGPASATYSDAQLNPDHLVSGPNLYQRLEAAGVRTEIVNAGQYRWSSISRFTGAGSRALKDRFNGYVTPADGFAQARERLLAGRPGGRSYTYIYVPTLDTVAHNYGPLTSGYRAEAAALDFALGRELLAPLARRDDVALLLLADHGQRRVEQQHTLWINDHPELGAMLAAPLVGDGRAGYLFVKHGMRDAAAAYVARHCADRFLALPKEEAVSAGLFGTPGAALSAEAEDRAGDLLLIPTTDWVARQHLTTDPRRDGFTGVHAGLSRAEMLVPFLALRMT